MEELSIEEKARRYDEAIERANELNYVSDKDSLQRKTVEHIFPELKESEDKKIRKELTGFLKRASGGFLNTIIQCKIFGKWLAWLERQGRLMKALQISNSRIAELVEEKYNLEEKLKKQGEQKPYAFETMNEKRDFDSCFTKMMEKEQKPVEVEPKFKVGYWYQCTKDFFGKGVTFDKNTAYYCAKEGCLQNEYGCHIAIVKDLYDNFKLWTIQDAKDGEVLYSLDSYQPFIYKERKPFEQTTAYCGINKYGKFFVWNTKDCIIVLDKYVPATKEQRDTLLKAMADAGYTFDFEKKELKKIEQTSDWSEEDEQMLAEIVKDLQVCKSRNISRAAKDAYQNEIDWLKSLLHQGHLEIK